MVLRRLGQVEAEPVEQVGPDEVVGWRPAGVDERVEVRVQVSPAVLEPEQERVVVEPGRVGDDLVAWQVQIAGQPVSTVQKTEWHRPMTLTGVASETARTTIASGFV